MQTIYEPKGRAREYAELALNLYRGCSHGCTYCYCPAMLRMNSADFHGTVSPRNILPELERIAPRYAGKQILLCFTTDPYNPAEPEYELTRNAIRLLHRYHVGVRILTKGGLRSTRDFDLLGSLDAYGATLTFCRMADSLLWEPGAPTHLERVVALTEAHDRGIHTWVSLEPVIDPEQTLELINLTHSVVDEYKLGKWNHDVQANKIDWTGFLRKALMLFEKHSKRFYIKEDLRRYLP